MESDKQEKESRWPGMWEGRINAVRDERKRVQRVKEERLDREKGEIVTEWV